MLIISEPDPTDMPQLPYLLRESEQPPVNMLMQGSVETLHGVAAHAQALIDIVMDGETRFTEEELDALEALRDALSEVRVTTV